MTAIDRTQPFGERDDAAGTESPRWERAAALFVRWRGGETRAMDDLVRLMTPVLWHVARAYGLDRALAEDVVQSTWMALVRRHAAIEEPRAISGWLTLCARREAWRVSRLQRRVDPIDAELLEPLLPRGESAERQAQRGTESGALWLAVGALNPRCQRLLRVVAFDERPDYARIAQDLAMPIGSIGPTRQRCLGKLRALLQQDGWEEDEDDR
ncbi:RNA polymerase sigma factor [Microbacterium azadirachtae]|uniref:RNA polymerase sigma factor n=1 Tax=Microbacterium azadirachtae TaxID=582680 RepID=UPI000888E779|nr:sigma-70 family RNA polymerase sigma factor [Microbacterium azadirachtae]SDM03152.1 RNA polymerase sigma factor, sigma-70 family [Microbacterium azadirachtae]SEG28749.1 RNA polymerase sigma factor, sigma-70 family [Microbacterium azadirachtae]SEG31673.1 RNA polymerase sigma factor, sigma-70 family [Microbacterium azadirachtae]